eukprot:4641406-Prymnesium_polylepis.1
MEIWILARKGRAEAFVMTRSRTVASAGPRLANMYMNFEALNGRPEQKAPGTRRHFHTTCGG